jgi:hypothetical protein
MAVRYPVAEFLLAAAAYASPRRHGQHLRQSSGPRPRSLLYLSNTAMLAQLLLVKAIPNIQQALFGNHAR